MIFIMFGAPASGKGTHSAKLSEALDIPCISTGDMLRAEEAKNTSIWQEAKEIMMAGGLVPDDIVLTLIKKRIAEADCSNGFIFDGFPRTIPQKDALDNLLQEINKKVTGVIQLDVQQAELEARNKLRAEEASTAGKPTRPDDDPDVFKKRLVTYSEWTAPVLESYRQQGVDIHKVDANGSKKQTAEAVTRAISAMRSKTTGTAAAGNLENVRNLVDRAP